jgi:hypothetical protein
MNKVDLRCFDKSMLMRVFGPSREEKKQPCRR